MDADLAALRVTFEATWEKLLGELPLTPAERKHPLWIREDAPELLALLRALAAAELPAEILARVDQGRVSSLLTTLHMSRLTRALGGPAEMVDAICRLAGSIGMAVPASLTRGGLGS